MAIEDSYPMRFTPSGICDAYDASQKFPGACQRLQNLVFDQANPEDVVSRPGTVSIASFTVAGFLTPTFISVMGSIGTRIYGMIGTSRNAGHDEPFVYETATSSFIIVTGTISSGTTPASPATGGDWIPPTICNVGVMIVVTHPGFPGGATKFGWFDITNPATPVWHAGDTATTTLTATPSAAANFNNRIYFAVGNQVQYTDVLTNPPTITFPTQALVIGDQQPINALAGLPMQTTSSGIIGNLLIFKLTQVWQASGDPTLNNQALNYISLTTGTTAPRSVVQAPIGTYFMSSGGPYFVDQLGTLRAVTYSANEQEPDLQVPFQNAINPTRWAAAYNSSLYRICGMTVVQGIQITGDYWFDEHKRRWNGPHTFAYDSAVAIGGYFVLSSFNNPGQLIQSFPDKSASTIFTDLNSPIAVDLLSCAFPKTNDMLTKQVAESQIELTAQGGNVIYSVEALDETFAGMGAVVMQIILIAKAWGAFIWGDGTLWSVANTWGGGSAWGTTLEGGSNLRWGTSQPVPTTYRVPWGAPLVFEKMMVHISATASAQMSIGTFFARYQKTGYMTPRDISTLIVAPNPPPQF